MSEFPKKMTKRSRSDCSEDTSFVQNVTSRISSFLPATITKWFSPSSSNAQNNTNGSVPTSEINDLNSEEGTSDFRTGVIQPPAKRIKLSSPRNNLDFGPMVSTSISDLETLRPIKKYNGNNFVESHLSSAEEVSPSIKYTSDSMESHVSDAPPEEVSSRTTYRTYMDTRLSESSSEESESAYKSVYKRRPIRSAARTFSDSSYPSLKDKSLIDVSKRVFNSTSESIELMTEPSEKSTSTIDREKKMIKPSFKPCLLGSPFYSGRTTYGGAASSYVNRPNIIQQKSAIVSSTSKNDNTTSHAAQRVRDLLERISCPLAEARRIPTVQPDYSRENFLNRLRNMSPMLEQKNTSYYRTQELHAPTVASVLRLKKRSRLMDTTNLARQIIASHSSTSDSVPCITRAAAKRVDQEKSSQKFTTKMKTSLTRQKRGKDVEQVASEQPNLPNVTLQIDQSKLSNFSFGIKLATSSSSTPKTSTSSSSTPKTSTLTLPAPSANENFISKSPTTTIDNVIKFSKPVTLSEPIPLNEYTSPRGYTFGSPERSIENFNVEDTEKQKSEGDNESKTKLKDWKCSDCWVKNKDDYDKCCCCGGKKPLPKTNDTVIKINTNETKPAKPKGWQCADCWINNEDEADKCVCCGGKKTSKETKRDKCTVCKIEYRQPSSDLCATCQKVKLSNNLPLPKPDNSGKWQCSVCWVSNDVSSKKCISCGATNTKERPLPTTNHAEEKWKCNDCWINNNASDHKCAACGCLKPGNNYEPINITSKTNTETKLLNEDNNSYKNVMYSQSDKWECSNCLVANENSKDKCVCCGHAKPGMEEETDNSPFHFAVKPNVTFKFVIDSQTDSIPDDQMTDESKTNDEHSETNNNIVTKGPPYLFGMPAKKPEDEIAKDRLEPGSNYSFSFGVPSISKHQTFKLVNKIVDETSTKIEEKENPQEVPKVDLLAPKPEQETKFQEPLKISSNLFSFPTPTKIIDETKTPPTVVPAAMFSLPFGQNKTVEKITEPITFGIPATTNNSELKGFTFSNTISKPVTVIEPPLTLSLPTPVTLLAPASDTAPASSTAALTIAPTVITTTTSVTLPAQATFTFQKPASTTPTLSLFQKPESSATTTTLFQPKTTEPVQAAIASPVSTSTAPFYNFGSTSAASNATEEKPKFNFSFSKANDSDSSTMFKFGASNDTAANANNFQAPAGNGVGNATNTMPFGGGSAIGNSLTGGTGLPKNTSLTSGNSSEAGGLTVATGLFSTAKENNMWANNNNAPGSLFGSPSSTAQKPAPFAFGPPTFGSAQTQSMFGTPALNTSVASLFGTSGPAPVTQTSLFGSSPAQSTGMFGTPPAFGAPNQAPSVPSFEAPLTQPPTPAFNFGSPQSTGMFGFGQGGTGAQSGSVYAFGGGAGTAGAGVPALQFNMGSAPTAAPAAPAARKMRRAARRIPR